MKKIICLGIVLIFVLTALTGCMKKDNEDDSTLSSTMSEIGSTIDEPSSDTQSSSNTQPSSNIDSSSNTQSSSQEESGNGN